jgi:hypothetical protein
MWSCGRSRLPVSPRPMLLWAGTAAAVRGDQKAGRVITTVMRTVPGAVSRSSPGTAAVPCGELSDPGHAHQLETGCVQPGKSLGVVQAGD